jgi:hypothetical protein
MNRKPVFRIVKRPGEERYVVEQRVVFGWKHVDVRYNRERAEELVAELEANPSGVVYRTERS